MIRHLAIVTTEILPPVSHPCAGGGVRAWGLGESLRRQGLSCTYFLLEGVYSDDKALDFIPHCFYRPEQLSESIAAAGCDAVLFEQWQPLTFLSAPLDIPVFVDLPGPLALEYLWRDPDNFYQHVVDKVECLSRADYFLCAHERQRGYYNAWLTWAGVDPGESRIAVAPFVFHELPVSRQGHVEDEPLFFWGGMFWPWQDRTEAFETLLKTFERIRRGQLVIVGVSDRSGSPGGLDYSYADHPHVTWLGSLPFSEYVMELKRSAVAVDLCRPTEERRLSSDLRTGTALWSGAPCIVTPDSPWAAWIEECGGGWIVEYGDAKSLANLAEEIALERVDIVAKRRGAKAISQRISRDDNVAPIMKWLSNPAKRQASPDFFQARAQDRERRIRDMQKEIDLLRHEKYALQHDLDSIRSNPLFRLYKKACFWK